jgi:hypothetical protein
LWRRKHDSECNPIAKAIEIEKARQEIYNRD